jgi:hypothetical protein
MLIAAYMYANLVAIGSRDALKRVIAIIPSNSAMFRYEIHAAGPFD